MEKSVLAGILSRLSGGACPPSGLPLLASIAVLSLLSVHILEYGRREGNGLSVRGFVGKQGFLLLASSQPPIRHQASSLLVCLLERGVVEGRSSTRSRSLRHDST
eukprot:5006257-Karenia_brevis.AAC.1